jgi:hypothetical protein
VIGGCSEASGEGVGDVGDGDVDDGDAGGYGGSDGSGFATSDLLTDDEGNLILDDQGNPIVGDPTTTNDAYSTTVSGDETGAGTNSSDTGFTPNVTSTLIPTYFPPQITGPLLLGPAPKKPPSPAPHPTFLECLITPNQYLGALYPATMGKLYGGPSDTTGNGGNIGVIYANVPPLKNTGYQTNGPIIANGRATLFSWLMNAFSCGAQQ